MVAIFFLPFIRYITHSETFEFVGNLCYKTDIVHSLALLKDFLHTVADCVVYLCVCVRQSLVGIFCMNVNKLLLYFVFNRTCWGCFGFLNQLPFAPPAPP